MLASHGVDQGQGLADAEVELKRAEFGTNELDKDEGTPLWKLVPHAPTHARFLD